MSYYIENLIELDVDTEIEIGCNLRIRSATAEEQIFIKLLMSGLGFSQKLDDLHSGFHEHSMVKRLPEGGIQLKKRAPKDFRYFVLEEMEKTGIYNQDYVKALYLTDKEFFIPFGFDTKSDSRGGVALKYSFDSELSAYTYFNDNKTDMIEGRSEFLNEFTDEDKSQLLKNLALVNEFEEIEDDYPFLKQVLYDYFKILEISNRSAFKIIPLFACLELLLVESKLERPKSRALQLESKLDLVNNRIVNPVLVSDYISVPNSLTLGKVIGIIHDYKSCIAHGDFGGFEEKLQIVGNTSAKDIVTLARKVVKSLILFALEEPQLITDLKKC